MNWRRQRSMKPITCCTSLCWWQGFQDFWAPEFWQWCWWRWWSSRSLSRKISSDRRHFESRRAPAWNGWESALGTRGSRSFEKLLKNYCHPPDAISASIKRSSKIESLPRSLPHWGEILKGSFREDIFWEGIKSAKEDIEHFSFFVCTVSRVVGGYKDGNFVCNTKGEELNFMLEINRWKSLTKDQSKTTK